LFVVVKMLPSCSAGGKSERNLYWKDFSMKFSTVI
jgi:hypothetical protein